MVPPLSTSCSTKVAAPVRGDTILRRMVDLALGLPLLVLASPILLLAAILVKVEDRGPVFYRQVRVGRGERPFQILKFRSMVVDAEDLGPEVSSHRDPRITKIGRILRATKVDEVPQLFNVVKGEMTLFGPRPEVPRYVRHYSQEERQILTVRPGITGPGQVSFTLSHAQELDRVEDPEAHYIHRQLHPKLALDLDYLQHRTIGRELIILGRTIAVLFRRPK
ncbi:MAG: sugar transferase [Acidobacteriota bacterium]